MRRVRVARLGIILSKFLDLLGRSCRVSLDLTQESNERLALAFLLGAAGRFKLDLRNERSAPAHCGREFCFVSLGSPVSGV